MTEDIEHDDMYCADSNAEKPEGYDVGCHDGDRYGLCGAEFCYGQYENQGLCPCKCHEWDKP